MKDSGRMDWRQYRCSGLERNEAKVSRYVPRGERISNDPDLPDKTNTNVPGVKIIKIPAKYEIPERLGIEINPVNEAGRLIKKTGQIVLTNEELFVKYAELFAHPKVQELMQEIELLRHEMQDQSQDKQSIIFEI
ncbi:hypothetical protein ES708_17192 [subsurface metagenome]